MISTDPISDMLSRIRNAITVNKRVVVLPSSQTKTDVARLLVQNGFLKDYKVDKSGQFPKLEITINDEDNPAVITELRRLSKPGQREYVKAKKMPVVKRGRGIVIVSTSRGLMTGAEAKAAKLGGELVCEVY